MGRRSSSFALTAGSAVIVVAPATYPEKHRLKDNMMPTRVMCHRLIAVPFVMDNLYALVHMEREGQPSEEGHPAARIWLVPDYLSPPYIM
jgi:hypothetical protein